MKQKVVIIFFILLPFFSLATPQARDVVYWNGNKYYSYPSILKDKEDFRNLTMYINGKYGVEFMNTANYNGYICEFEIDEDTLYLLSIIDSYNVNYMEHIYGTNTRRIVNDYTGDMYLGYGEIIDFQEVDTPVYESEITVRFECGIVKSYKDNKNKSKSSSYNGIKLVEYIHENLNLENIDMTGLNDESKTYIEFKTDTVGNVVMTKILRSSGNEMFDKEAVRVVMSIPSCQVIFVKGKYQQSSLVQPVSYKMYKKYRVNR